MTINITLSGTIGVLDIIYVLGALTVIVFLSSKIFRSVK